MLASATDRPGPPSRQVLCPTESDQVGVLERRDIHDALAWVSGAQLQAGDGVVAVAREELLIPGQRV